MRIAVPIAILGLAMVLTGGPDAAGTQPGSAPARGTAEATADTPGPLPLGGLQPDPSIATPTPTQIPPEPPPMPLPQPVPWPLPVPDPPSEPPSAEPPTPAHPDEVAYAIDEVAEDTGVEPDEVDVVTHEHVTWRDASLGCPKPGEMYAQVLTPGYRIVLRAAGEEFHYHGADGDMPFRCDDPDPNGAVDD